MLAALPNQARDTGGLQAGPSMSSSSEVDKFCAGCSRSVNSETGGVVVAFGNSLWHVDCFKCAKCSNLVNADTNLLLLSDGSPVCANCYNCKICNLPILDEAVMTGDDSYHAACFTCRSCRNRIDELVFAKTSQGFYCMKCHNERVARSRRHAAKQKQKDRERQAMGSAGGRNGISVSASSSTNSRHGTLDHTHQGHELSSSVTRSDSVGFLENGYGDAHGNLPQRQMQSPPQSSSRDTDSANNTVTDPNASVANMSSASANSAADATFLHPDVDRRSASPVPPAVSVTMAASSSSQRSSKEQQEYYRRRSHSPDKIENGDSSAGRLADNPPPPPYSPSPPANQVNFNTDSARSSGSYNQSPPGSAPLSPSLSRPNSYNNHRPTSLDRIASSIPLNHSSSSSLPYTEANVHVSTDRLPQRDYTNDSSQSRREESTPGRNGRRYDDGARPLSTLLLPNSQMPNDRLTGLSASQTKRDKRGSINPALQLEASRLLTLQSDSPLRQPSQPTSPTGSSTGPQLRTHSPTSPSAGRESPRVTSPLREYFVGHEEENVGSDRSSASNATAFYSPSTSPQARVERPSTSGHDATSSGSRTSPPTNIGAPLSDTRKEFLARLPQRSDSLRGGDSTAAMNSTAPTSVRSASSSSSRLGSLAANSPGPLLRTQRSFDERDGRLSPHNAAFGSDVGQRSRSVGPNPPDVPKSIESGTDTEAEPEADNSNDSEDITLSYLNMGNTSEADQRHSEFELPPIPPPKDGKKADFIGQARPSTADRRVQEAINATEEEAAAVGKGAYDDLRSPPPTTVERHSAFFTTPALPPMRFSMNGVDFRDILNNLGGSNSNLAHTLQQPSEISPTTIQEEKEDVAVSLTPTSTTSATLTIAPSVDAHGKADSHSGHAEHATPKATRRPATAGAGATLSDTTTSNENLPHMSPSSPSRPAMGRKYPHRASRSETAIKLSQEPSSSGSSSESHEQVSPKTPAAIVITRERSDSLASQNMNGGVASEQSSARQAVAAVPRSSLSKQEMPTDLLSRRLKEVLQSATDRGADYVKMDTTFVEAILNALEQKKDQVLEMSGKLDGMKRTSQLMFDGLSVAQDEYTQELSARRNAEAEISLLKIELSGQTARLTALTSDQRRREVQKQLSREISDNLTGLERDLSKLKVERDLTLAEVEELSATKEASPAVGEAPTATVGRSMTLRLENIKKQYQNDLMPLTQQKEALAREIRELKDARDVFIEETAVLYRRNEELAQLSTEYERRLDSSTTGHSKQKSVSSQPKQSMDTWRGRQAPPIVNTASTASTSSTATLIDESSEENRVQKSRSDVADTPQSKNRGIQLRWPGNKSKDLSTSHALQNGDGKGRKRVEHAFQQLSILRFARCDHCGDKMWGSQVRCSVCNVSVHVRCVGLVQSSCNHDETQEDAQSDTVVPLQRSMFGRDLTEQVHADANGSDRFVPVIVEKCIDAVEALAMDYEGIYRKSGGSGQSKKITQLFERGNYESFDLRDTNAFNDISSVTSVLKNYFRALPNPLLTYELHEAFVQAANYKDSQAKADGLTGLVKQLPSEHFHTLGHLMLHLCRVQEKADVNKMTARNLGVVFGPTLMRHSDPSLEFSDMAGKTLAVEWLIENAPSVFPPLI